MNLRSPLKKRSRQSFSTSLLGKRRTGKITCPGQTRPIFRTRRTARCHGRAAGQRLPKKRAEIPPPCLRIRQRKPRKRRRLLPEHQRGRAQKRKRNSAKRPSGNSRRETAAPALSAARAAVRRTGNRKIPTCCLEGILTASPWRSVKSSAKSAM